MRASLDIPPGDCNVPAHIVLNRAATWPYQGSMGILTITLNPAVDLETRTPELVPGDKLRCTPPRVDPGGGGINVARAIHVLGGQARAAVAVGGPVGTGLVERLRAAGHDVRRHCRRRGETRQNLSVIEEDTGAQYRFIFPGPDWRASDLDAALESAAAAGAARRLRGAFGLGAAWAGAVGVEGPRAGAQGPPAARSWSDTSGAPLAEIARAGLGLKVLRMDQVEAEELVGRKLRLRGGHRDVGSDLVASGAAEIAILARGAEGSVLVTSTERWFAPAADVPVVSVTGAGDSFVAGATLALSRDMAFAGRSLLGILRSQRRSDKPKRRSCATPTCSG